MKNSKESVIRALFISLIGASVAFTPTLTRADSAPQSARAALEKALLSVQGQKNIAPILPYTDFNAFFAGLTEEEREMTGAANGSELKAFYEASSTAGEEQLDKLKVEDIIDPKQRLSPDQRTSLEGNLPQILEYTKQVTREANAQVAACVFSVVELAEETTNASGKVKCATNGKSYVSDVTLVKSEDHWKLGSLKFIQDILTQILGIDNEAKEMEKQKKNATSEGAEGNSSL